MSIIASTDTKPSALHPPSVIPDRDEFEAWTDRMERTLYLSTQGEKPLFIANVDDLFDVYLKALPDTSRLYHNCHTCRKFVNHYGTIVVIDKAGDISSPIWSVDDAPEYYRPAVAAMIDRLKRARVSGVFRSGKTEWGIRKTGDWRHFNLTPTRYMIHSFAHQRQAEKAEDFKTVIRSLEEFPRKAIEQALLILRNDALYRSEKVLGPVQWLYDLTVARQAATPSNRANVVWLAIATAPAGFCHPRSSMAGTLLEDIINGLDMDAIKRRFAEKMHPLQYQRPSAPPSAGNIRQAEAIVEQMGIANSLRRRYARPDDIVKLLWTPKQEEQRAPAGGVFGHLLPDKNHVEQTAVPETTITWEKFAKTVLADALTIEVMVLGLGPYAALVTAEDPASPPIIQWDREDLRNPVSWYMWNGGSPASQWGLSANTWANLWGITPKPCMWNGELKNHANGVILLIEGSKESRTGCGLALFPEVLRSELHKIRSTIEAHSRSGRLGNAEGPHACGLMLGTGNGDCECKLRVRTKLGVAIYSVDRWD